MPKNVLIFGASGQVGKNLIRKLTKNNYRCIAQTRSLHQRGIQLKTQGSAGWIECVEANIFDEQKLRNLVSKADICINLIGILYESGQSNTFKNINEKFPELLSALCKEYNVHQLIHLSSLGIEEAKDSSYAKSKINGELILKKNFEKSVILKPSVIYSVDDNFTTKFMTLLNLLPIFPLYYQGSTLFRPIHISDLTEIIYQIINQNINSTIIECIGPEEISLKNILLRLLKLINKKRFLIPFPLFFAKILASFFQIFPNPLLTIDQLKLLKYNNIPSGKYKTNFDLDMSSHANFDVEVEKYCYMWKDQGQFSKINQKDYN